VLTQPHGRLTAGVNTSTPITVAALVGAASDDARELWSIVALLAVVGVAMAMATVAVVKATRPDRELLAPLEVMGRRKWRRSDPVWQRRQLDEVRPPGAQPLTLAPAAPVPLEGFDEGPAADGFDDLADLGSGVDHDLTELPDGMVFDADPTPLSGEVPAIVVGEPAPEVPLADLGVDWSSPDATDLVAADELVPEPVYKPDRTVSETGDDETDALETADGATVGPFDEAAPGDEAAVIDTVADQAAAVGDDRTDGLEQPVGDAADVHDEVAKGGAAGVHNLAEDSPGEVSG